MSYRGLFPTRTGTPIGTGGERQMLDRVGAYGFRKDYRTEADGSVTMLTTKNGMPRFQNFGIGASDQEDTTTYTAYLESGKLSWVFPHQESPYKYDPAKWNFLDIPPSDQYLGYVKNAWITDTAKFTGADGDQSNYPTLKEGQESQAIGYAKVVLTDRSTPTQISLAAIKDAETKQEVGDITVMKKMVAGLFPASLFTGKMRLFMQATYGAMTSEYPLSIELLGESVLLWYSVNGVKIQLGFWSHKTHGIYTAPDGTFWLLDVVMHTGAVTVTAYPITPSANVKGLVKRYKAGAFSGEEKTKVEAYIFASSVIDVSKPVVVGSHTTAAASGGAMAYGWKFNTDGDIAKIVVSTGSGTGTAARWTSYTITLNLTYADGAISVSGSTVLNGDWMDGWGTFNMFVPDSETATAPLSHFSITSGFPRPDFDFPITEIYGYFKDNVWVPVKVSRSTLTGPWPKRVQSYTGLRVASVISPTTFPLYQYSYTAANEGYSWEGHEIYSGTTMDLVVGDVTYAGTMYAGTHYYVTREVVEAGTYPNAVSFTASQVGSGTFVDGDPPGHYHYDGPSGYVVAASVTKTDMTITGSDFFAWTLVIPCLDCEAAFVATNKYTNASSVTKSIQTNGAGISRFVGPGYDYAPWASTDTGGNGWYGSYGPGFASEYFPAAPPPPEVVKIFCHTAALSNVQGTPAHSYSSIFSVDYTYPYYDPGMYSLTSYGKRYDISEGLTSHPSVGDQPRFVGWA